MLCGVCHAFARRRGPGEPKARLRTTVKLGYWFNHDFGLCTRVHQLFIPGGSSRELAS